MMDHFHQFRGRQTLNGEAVWPAGGDVTNRQRRTMFHTCDVAAGPQMDLDLTSVCDVQTRRQQVTAISGAPPVGNGGGLLLALLILVRNRYVGCK